MARRTPRQTEALRVIAAGNFYPTLVREDDGWYARWRGLGIENSWIDEYVRTFCCTPLTVDAEDQRHVSLHDAWMSALRSRTGLVRWDDAECAAFARELSDWADSADENVDARRAIVFAFRPPADGAGEFRLSCAVPRGRLALRALGQSMYVFPPLRGLRRSENRLVLSLGRADAEEFVRTGANDLRTAGYGVEGVEPAAPVVVELTQVGDSAVPPKGNRIPVRLAVRVAGEIVTAREVRFLLEQGSTLVFFRNRWIEVDRNLLKQALRALERTERTHAVPLGFAFGIGRVGNLEVAELKAGGWLRGFVDRLRKGDRFEFLDLEAPIPGFCGELRGYQRRGVEWIRFLTDNGFGALLADDMGLGKTVQTIAWLLSCRAERPEGRALVVAPLSVLENWRREFARFAPSIRVFVHQGSARPRSVGFRRQLSKTDVVLTSYNLLVRDYPLFSDTAWDALVLDEAQFVKNPETQAARAVCALRPVRRLALTGTPIENSVTDLWSIEEFLNPGFLDDRKSFVERFVKPLALDGKSGAGRRLRHAVEPFVLRRRKTDAEIAGELGEKREIREYCPLTHAQRAAYEAAMADFRIRDRARGDVFALITELKHICDGEGKLMRLFDLVESIFEADESALVFTQYAQVGSWLRDELTKRFGRRMPFLHGGLSPAQREAEIRAFNRGGPQAFVLSLRAGGFGLNLTKATHVIHFDRWWNPAVEDQATDRAHRIGQGRDVFVHLFITTGTLEEHVDELIESKSRIAGSIITDMEWLEAAKLDV